MEHADVPLPPSPSLPVGPTLAVPVVPLHTESVRTSGPELLPPPPTSLSVGVPAQPMPAPPPEGTPTPPPKGVPLADEPNALSTRQQLTPLEKTAEANHLATTGKSTALPADTEREERPKDTGIIVEPVPAAAAAAGMEFAGTRLRRRSGPAASCGAGAAHSKQVHHGGGGGGGVSSAQRTVQNARRQLLRLQQLTPRKETFDSSLSVPTPQNLVLANAVGAGGGAVVAEYSCPDSRCDGCSLHELVVQGAVEKVVQALQQLARAGEVSHELRREAHAHVHPLGYLGIRRRSRSGGATRYCLGFGPPGTPLQFAVVTGRIEAALQLLASGADAWLSSTSPLLPSAYSLAKQNGLEDLVELFDLHLQTTTAIHKKHATLQRPKTPTKKGQ